MDRANELALGDELLRWHREGSPKAAAPHRPITAEAYTSPERHRAELRVLDAHPVAAVHTSEIAAPGDFVTVRLGGVPVIISRDRAGRVSAMHNACAHRGATVEHRESGSARIFSCAFHGWSYDLDGSLRAVSDPGRFSTESKSCTKGLRRLPCEERHGIVWVTPGADAPARSVAEWLGPELDATLGALAMDTFAFHAAEEYDLGCNWKLLTDGFCELYHLKYLHRSSIAPYFPANLAIPLGWGDHLGSALPKNRLLRHLEETPRDEWRVLGGLTMPFVLMPATVIQWQAGHVELFSLRPDREHPGRTVCRLSLLVPGDRRDETELWDRNWDRVRETIPAEDFAAAEEVQANMDAGIVDEIQIGDNERQLLQHMDTLDRLVAAVSTR